VKAPTLREIRQWPATVDVPTAAAALGIGRSTLYDWIRIGQAPVKTISVRNRRVVITSSLIRLLEDDGAARPART
jgi:predicted DNA-binding transcriptional regulator AlpA